MNFVVVLPQQFSDSFPPAAKKAQLQRRRRFRGNVFKGYLEDGKLTDNEYRKGEGGYSKPFDV